MTLTLIGCEVNGWIDNDAGTRLVATDCDIDGGNTSRATIGFAKMDLLRCNITGGQHSVIAYGDSTIRECILHDQYNDPNAQGTAAYHNNSWLSNGGGSGVLIEHCTLICRTEILPNGGGPTATFSFHGDFGDNDDITLRNNLIGWTTALYSAYGGYNAAKSGLPTNVTFEGNRWERGPNGTGQGGGSGPITGWLRSATNTWTNNAFIDGVVIPEP